MTTQEILKEYRKITRDLKTDPAYPELKKFYYCAKLNENSRKYSIVRSAKAVALALDKASVEQQDDQEIIQTLDNLFSVISIYVNKYEEAFETYAKATFKDTDPKHITKVRDDTEELLLDYVLALGMLIKKVTKN